MSASVLIVDDDLDLADSLADLLEDRGFAVETCPDVPSALEKAGRHNFDVLLLDMMLPGDSGLEGLLKLRRLLPGARSILMTGYSPEELVRRALNGNDDLREGLSIESFIDHLTTGGVFLARCDQDGWEALLARTKDAGLNIKVAHDRTEASQMESDLGSALFFSAGVPPSFAIRVATELMERQARSAVVLQEHQPGLELSQVPAEVFRGRYLVKPFDPSQLLTKLRKELDAVPP